MASVLSLPLQAQARRGHTDTRGNMGAHGTQGDSVSRTVCPGEGIRVNPRTMWGTRASWNSADPPFHFG